MSLSRGRFSLVRFLAHLACACVITTTARARGPGHPGICTTQVNYAIALDSAAALNSQSFSNLKEQVAAFLQTASRASPSSRFSTALFPSDTTGPLLSSILAGGLHNATGALDALSSAPFRSTADAGAEAALLAMQVALAGAAPRVPRVAVLVVVTGTITDLAAARAVASALVDSERTAAALVVVDLSASSTGAAPARGAAWMQLASKDAAGAPLYFPARPGEGPAVGQLQGLLEAAAAAACPLLCADVIAVYATECPPINPSNNATYLVPVCAGATEPPRVEPGCVSPYVSGALDARVPVEVAAGGPLVVEAAGRATFEGLRVTAGGQKCSGANRATVVLPDSDGDGVPDCERGGAGDPPSSGPAQNTPTSIPASMTGGIFGSSNGQDGAMSIRLTNAHSPADSSYVAGRLEVHVDGTWGAACAYHSNRVAADVACRELGLRRGAFLFFLGPLPAAAPSYKLASLTCRGNEPALDACTLVTTDAAFIEEHCTEAEALGLVCTDGEDAITGCDRGARAVDGDIRLDGDLGSCDPAASSVFSGRLQVSLQGEWSTVCGDDWLYYHSQLDTASSETEIGAEGFSTRYVNPVVACGELGFDIGFLSSYRSSYSDDWVFDSRDFPPAALDSVTCNGYEQRFMECDGGEPQDPDGLFCESPAHITCLNL